MADELVVAAGLDMADELIVAAGLDVADGLFCGERACPALGCEAAPSRMNAVFQVCLG